MSVLLLNQDWSALAVTRISRALSLVQRGKAEILETGVAPIKTSSCSIPRPSVIRLTNFIKRPRPKERFTRRNVFKRDDFTCQFCGVKPRVPDLTIDHVHPASRGGVDSWENIVSACVRCNRKKGARTPEEARMPLRNKPKEPVLNSYLHLSDIQPEWLPFLPASV